MKTVVENLWRRLTEHWWWEKRYDEMGLKVSPTYHELY